MPGVLHLLEATGLHEPRLAVAGLTVNAVDGAWVEQPEAVGAGDDAGWFGWDEFAGVGGVVGGPPRRAFLLWLVSVAVGWCRLGWRCGWWPFGDIELAELVDVPGPVLVGLVAVPVVVRTH